MNIDNISIAKQLLRDGWLGHALAHCRLAKSDDRCKIEAECLEDLILQFINNKDVLNLSLTETPIYLTDQQIFSSLHFYSPKSEELKQAIFKASVNYIDIETSSQCNRRCLYCTNSTNDRLSANVFMDHDVYVKFIKELALIDYKEELHFVGYNEPLMHRDSIVKNLIIARRSLPNAKLVVFTNGDYLDHAYLDELCAAGVDKLMISVHLAPGAPYDDASVLDRIYRLSLKLKTRAVLVDYEKNERMSFQLLHQKCFIYIFQRDYMKLGHNRGGLLDGVGKAMPGKRSAACLKPLNQFIVGYTGKVLPCCTLVSDDERHAGAIVGDLSKESIFDIYCGERYVAWRKGTLNLKHKHGPCEYCPDDDKLPSHLDQSVYSAIERYLEATGDS